MSDWDWSGQRSDTESVFEDLMEKTGIALGAAINLDVQTITEGGGDREAYVAALKSAGYKGSAYSDDDGNETIEVTFEDAAFDVESIWAREEAVTKIALQHGYRPDGWGFWEPGT